MQLRGFTPGEKALGFEMFGASLDAGRVRIFFIPVWKRAFTPSGWLMVWPARGRQDDFSAAPLAVQSVFVHELTHVWQAQHGVLLPLAKIKAGDSDSAYAYDLVHGPSFADLNIEQQAMVVEHAFLSSRGATAQHPRELYAKARDQWMQA